MDFLDPKKRRAHAIRLMFGYVLLGVAVLLGTLVLLYQANGFGVRQGKVIQNGLVFVSSRPGGATIYLNGQQRESTGARLLLPAGTYKMQLQRDGYRTWQRSIPVEGNSVAHYDYPLLIPNRLVTTATANYTAVSSLALQTPDRRWLLVEHADKLTDFDMYDLNNYKKVASSVKHVSMPANLLSDSTGPNTLALVEASNDNRHFLLQHTFDNQVEYILLDRQDPTASINVTKQLHLPATTTVTLQNKKYDHYFLRDTATQALGTATLSDPATTTPIAAKVLDYKAYGNDDILYTSPSAENGQTDIRLLQRGKTYTLRTVHADKKYLLDLAQYDGSWFVAAGVPSEDKVYIYQDPADDLNDKPDVPLVPKDVLKVYQPDFIKFSANTQYIMASNGSRFAVYDAEQDKHYAFTIDSPLDPPQLHADWMDGNRIAYVSGGKLVEFDYDGTNYQALSAAMPGEAFFDRDYQFVYSLAPPSAVTKPAADAKQILTNTSLLTPRDM